MLGFVIALMFLLVAHAALPPLSKAELGRKAEVVAVVKVLAVDELEQQWPERAEFSDIWSAARVRVVLVESGDAALQGVVGRVLTRRPASRPRGFAGPQGFAPLRVGHLYRVWATHGRDKGLASHDASFRSMLLERTAWKGEVGLSAGDVILEPLVPNGVEDVSDDIDTLDRVEALREQLLQDADYVRARGDEL